MKILRAKKAQIIQELSKEAQVSPDAKTLLKKLSSKAVISDEALKNAYSFLTQRRNRHLITTSQQSKLSRFVISIYGMSVGSHVARSWVLLARPTKLYIADPDTIDFSNLNRLPYDVSKVGRKKTEVIQKELKSIHPYIRIETSAGSLRPYLHDASKDSDICALVDEMDNLHEKYMLRKLAKARKIPVISATDVGETVVIDIERYDVDRSLKPFLGRIPEIHTIEFSSLSPAERLKLVYKLVDLHLCSVEMLRSLHEIGESLTTWPQLGSTATIAGGIVTTVLKKIALGEKVRSGRYEVSLENLFMNENTSEDARKRDLISQLIDDCTPS